MSISIALAFGARVATRRLLLIAVLGVSVSVVPALTPDRAHASSSQLPALGGGALLGPVETALSDAGSATSASAGPDLSDAASSEAGHRVLIRPDQPSVAITDGEQAVRMTLQDAAAGHGEAAQGTYLHRGVARDTDVAVRVAAPGTAQMLAIMHTATPGQSQRYRLDLPAGMTLRAEGGGFELVAADGSVHGAVAAPWAKDATGRDLATTYTLEGDVLEQHTDTRGAVPPIVADPKLTFGWGVYLNMWGWELRAAAVALVAAGGGTAAIGCTLIGKLPNQFLKSLATLLCGAGAVSLPKVWAAIKRTWSSIPVDNGACYQQKVLPGVDYRFKPVRRSNCR